MTDTDARADVAADLGSGAVQEPRSTPRPGILIGYARCSTEKQDLSAQRQILNDLGVSEDRVYLDHGLSGTNRSRPGLDNAVAALSEGDTLVVPKLDRLARSVPDARAIGDSLAARRVRLSLGGSVYDPSDPMGKYFFNILAAFAEFEVDLLRMRTREGMAIARAKGRLKGNAPGPDSLHGERRCTSSPAMTSVLGADALMSRRSGAFAGAPWRVARGPDARFPLLSCSAIGRPWPGSFGRRVA
jgi:DNA invertase Pin-like site-specific DNA recombinase